MPLDAMTTAPNALDSIISTSLSATFVEAHKQAVIEEFAHRGIRERTLVRSKMVYWVTTWANSYNLKKMLRSYHAPKEVQTLAFRIKKELPEAQFGVQWFYDDPILDMRYRGEVHHLAIWANKHELIAIAKATPVVSWWRRLFR